jgi:hypothetical protein
VGGGHKKETKARFLNNERVGRHQVASQAFRYGRAKLHDHGNSTEFVCPQVRALLCYAWSYQDNGETQYVTALEIPPVESPITAVRAAIMAEAKGKK